METKNKFRKFWIMSVNNWLCDADYNGKRLKENNPFPTFRKFYFIKSWEDLKYFTKHEGHENKDLCEKWLSEKQPIELADNVGKAPYYL